MRKATQAGLRNGLIVLAFIMLRKAAGADETIDWVFIVGISLYTVFED